MAVCIAAGGLCGVSAQALEWSTGHSLTTGAGSDSNISLSPTDPKDAQYATASVAAEVLGRRPGLSFRLQPEVRAQRYADNAVDDRNDAFATFGLDFDKPLRSFSLDGNYARESTLTSELEEGGLLGRLDVERIQRGADAAYRRTLRGGHRLGVAASDAETSYGSSPDPAYGDYGVRSVELSHAVATSERSSRTVVARKSFVDQSATARRSTTTELRATWSRRLSPYLQGAVGIGAFVVRRPNGESEDPSGLLDLSLSRDWLRWTFTTSAARHVQPETGGIVVVEDSVGMSAQRRLNDRLGIGLHLSGANESSAIEGPFDYERTYSTAGATASWQLARRMSLYASVYESTEHSTLTPRASSIAAFVSFTYRSG